MLCVNQKTKAKLTLPEAEAIAASALEQDSAQQVRELLTHPHP
ncbi:MULTISPECIES: hypothetical protein [Nostoc]|nr:MULTISPECIES: hypothetical protein [Nostoc]